MNKWYNEAVEKLSEESKQGKFDRHASAMKSAVCDALKTFAQQDAEFAQAIVQGGSFEECMAAVAKNCGSAISDLEAYRRGVQFYFPGADVQFHMTVSLCPMEEEEEERPKAKTKFIDLSDFL